MGLAMGRSPAIEPDFQRVYHQALRCLARRAHGEEELRRKLLAKGAPPALVESALARCRELGYLNDATFAAGLARHRLADSRHGPLRIRAELRARGVEVELVEEALTRAREELEPSAAARAALERRYGTAPPADRRELKRRYDFLARRGFTAATIREVLREGGGAGRALENGLAPEGMDGT